MSRADCYLYYSDYATTGSKRVRKIDVTVGNDGVNAVAGSAQDVAGLFTGGSDGIVLSPGSTAGSDVLIVGGQATGKVFVVNTATYNPSAKNWVSHVANLPETHSEASEAMYAPAVDHVVVVNSSLVLAFSNDFGRSISRFNVLPGGDVTVGTPIAVTGDDAWISTIIVVPGATPKFFYTTAPESRTGNFGVATFNADWTAVSTSRVALNGAFHHGAYEPVTRKVYSW